MFVLQSQYWKQIKYVEHMCVFPFLIVHIPTYITYKALFIQILLHGYMPIKAIKPSQHFTFLWIKKKKVWCSLFFDIFLFIEKKCYEKTEKQRVQKIAILRLIYFVFLKFPIKTYKSWLKLNMGNIRKLLDLYEIW